ncbi:YdeI/OmpD-associated family protein [Marinomonas sp. 2405UD66-6]|uniref:YdeI/OmpD-associated family protein n=1 Tax=Marinomonas sp. 2405UD66-6 TaxID=3391834 RepID=UPI0039C93642
MSDPTNQNTLMFSTANEIADWLRSHHDSKMELWVKIFKKQSGVMSVTWDDVVVESLCWGWIDGIKKSLDDQAYLQRITPRKSRSVWSKRNRDHVERLIAEGRMEEVGLVHVRAAQADGRWENAYSVSEMEVPEDFIKALEDYPEAKAFFAALTKSSRYVIAHGLTSAKKAETRQRRFNKFMDSLKQSQKPT